VSTSRVDLVRRSDGTLVEATLVDGVEPSDLIVVERAWTIVRARLVGRLRGAAVPRNQWPESWHWNWERKAPELAQLAASGFGILCDEDWQGLMLTKTAPYVARIEGDRGKPLVYVDYLEVAPWNWQIPALGVEGRYKGVGSILFREAVKLSLEEGFHGRIGLHALPQAEAFYDGACGMIALGRDPRKQDLVYFEFSREQARKFLEKGGD
jgi:hypothetical protein